MSKETVEKIGTSRPTDLPSALFQSPVVVVSEGQWPSVLETLQLQPTVQGFPDTCPQTLIQRHYEALDLTAKKHLPVRFLGYSPVFTGTRVYRGQGCDWALMNLTDDPLFYSNGDRLVIPSVAAQDIKAMLRAGINFDAMFIAHEIPIGSIEPGESVPLELIAPPPPPQVKQRLEKLDTAAGTFWQGVGSAIGSMLSMPASAFALPLAIVDPVLFGVYLDQSWLFQGQPIGMWYYVTHWYWPAEERSK